MFNIDLSLTDRPKEIFDIDLHNAVWLEDNLNAQRKKCLDFEREWSNRQVFLFQMNRS